jgi:hypothetical protein
LHAGHGAGRRRCWPPTPILRQRRSARRCPTCAGAGSIPAGAGDPARGAGDARAGNPGGGSAPGGSPAEAARSVPAFKPE